MFNYQRKFLSVPRNAIVRTYEDEVDASELLPRLDEDAGQSTETGFRWSTAETVDVASLACGTLGIESESNVDALLVNFGRALWTRRETSERLASLGLAPFEKKVTRRFGQEEHADSENRSPCELNCQT